MNFEVIFLPLFYIETFGCQMNERDSETISALLKEKGYEKTDDPKKADAIILNTCAVRQSAEEKVWSRLGRMAKDNEGRDMPVFVLAGCMAELPWTKDRVKKRLPYLRILTGPSFIQEIPSFVEKAQYQREHNLPIPMMSALSEKRGPVKDASTKILPEGLPRAQNPNLSAYVTIMHGCDNFCSYCIVPYVRGPQVSRQPEDILREIEDLAANGCKEVVLLGQNVNSYGMDLDSSYGFGDLLSDVAKKEGILRVRYYTSHPKDFSEKMISAVKDNPKICEHFHLPLQSGSDRILKRMNRGYTKARYLSLVDAIRASVPEASITTDIIVGFPGETEEDFQETLDVLKKAEFDGTFSFIFSPRKGTSAAKMQGQIQKDIKSERLQRLVEAQKVILDGRNEKLIGEEVEILVEETDLNTVKGRTKTNKVVTGKGTAPLGTLARVKVEEAGTWYLKGEVIN